MMNSKLVPFIIFMLFMICISNCYAQVSYGTGKNRYKSPYKDSSDVKTYDFSVEGLKNIEETKNLDKTLANKFGVISCYTNFNTKISIVKVYDFVDLVNIDQILTYKGYKVSNSDIQRYDRKKAFRKAVKK